MYGQTSALGDRCKGAVALEFLMLFPFVVAMLYSAAIYGIVFFSQYRLQDMVDRAVSTALYVDRSAYDQVQLQARIEDRANQTLSALLSQQSSQLNASTGSCIVEEVSGVEMLRCSLSYDQQGNPIVPLMSFGMLGTFPPLPDELKAEARAAF